jgi:undecaprenyl-diphosphatase
MSLLSALILGALEGLTEFLPVSSSGHLVLAETLLKLPVESLKSFDIAVHLGTLLAILVYFWHDIIGLIKGFFVWLSHIFGSRKNVSEDIKYYQRQAGHIIAATVPAVIFGLTLSDWLDAEFRSPLPIVIMMMTVGVLFFVAELIYSRLKTRSIRLREAIIMGFMQCLALIPGVSRSGITISAGIVQGVKRDEAARFSFLLGAVTIFGAAVFAVVEILKGKYALPAASILVTGIVSSFVVGLAAISFLMRYLRSHTLHIFGVYRVVLGFVLLYCILFTKIFG